MKSALPLEPFIALLRSSGFEITTEDRIALMRLLSTEQDWDLERLRRACRAIFVRTVDERAAFERLFDAFFPREPAGAAVVAPSSGSLRQRSWPRVALAAAAVVIAAATAWALLRPTKEPDGQKAEAGEVTNGPSAAATNNPNAAATNGPNADAAKAQNPDVAKPSDAPLANTPPSAAAREGAPRAAADDVPTPATPKALTAKSWLLLALSSLLLGALLMAYVGRRQRLSRQLSAPFTFEPSYDQGGPIRIPADPTLVEDLVSSLARRTARQASRRIDVPSTLRRTLREGFPAIVWSAPAAPPCFLVLVDWGMRFRGVATVLAEFVRALVDAGVRVEIYRFEREPSQCFRGGWGEQRVLLEALGREDFNGVLIFGDPDVACGMSPEARATWLAQLPATDRRIWLYPDPTMQDSLGVSRLREDGFRVELVTLRSFEALGKQAASSPAPPASPTVPRRPWDYQTYLGAAYPLLGAAALLPRLSPSAILFLASHLDCGATADEIARLCGLGWVADGRWPPGLRSEVAGALRRSPVLAERAEAAVANYLEKVSPEPATGAWNEYRLALLECSVETNPEAVQALFAELANGPEQARSILQGSATARSWARQNRFLALPREHRVAVVATALSVVPLGLAMAWPGDLPKPLQLPKPISSLMTAVSLPTLRPPVASLPTPPNPIGVAAGGNGAGGALPSIVKSVTPKPPLDPAARVAALIPPLAATAAPPGAKAVGDVLVGKIAQGESLVRSVQLNPGKCYTIVGAGEATIQNLDILLISATPVAQASSPVVAADNSEGAVAIIGQRPNCFMWALPLAAAMNLQVTVSAGHGWAAARVFESSSAPSTPVPAPVSPPPKPSFTQLDLGGRYRLFGKFEFEPAPTADNPEGIKILGNWVQENIVPVEIPQLKNVPGAADGKVRFHRAGERQLKALFQAWEDAGLMDRVLSWGGSFAPRFMRGSKATLSSYAWGNAFSINYQWNTLAAGPAQVGAKGSVEELVPIANRFGFYWGGHFANPDGQVFQLTVLQAAGAE